MTPAPNWCQPSPSGVTPLSNKPRLGAVSRRSIEETLRPKYQTPHRVQAVRRGPGKVPRRTYISP